MKEIIDYYYFSKAGKIACNIQNEEASVVYRYSMDVKNGWNKMYYRKQRKDGISTREYSTNNILTKEKDIKWIIRLYE